MASSSSSWVKKGWWSEEEDDVLRKLVAAHGTNSWSLISRSIPGRSGKSCRLRWCNQIAPDVERRTFTTDEDQLVVDTYRKIGNRWAAIARLLPGRTENSVKNRWHCNLKRRFSEAYHGDDDVKMMMMIQPQLACSSPKKKRKFDTEVTGDVKPVIHKTPLSLVTDIGDSGTSNKEEVTSAAQSSTDDPITILSLALPECLDPVMMPPTTTPPPPPVEDKIQELSDMRRKLLLDIDDELQQNRSVKIFGKLLHQGKIVE